MCVKVQYRHTGVYVAVCIVCGGGMDVLYYCTSAGVASRHCASDVL